MIYFFQQKISIKYLYKKSITYKNNFYFYDNKVINYKLININILIFILKFENKIKIDLSNRFHKYYQPT